MSTIAFFLIVFSAVLHASWNMIAKKSSMSVPFYATICTICALLWVHAQFWTPIRLPDLPWQFWAWIFASLTADACYCFGLVHAYQKMEMSSAYPMMRSLPLLFTAGLTTLFGWGDHLSWPAVAGMTVVFCGCMMMPLGRFSDFSFRKYWTWGTLFVILAAFGTTGYTIFDSQAQKVLSKYIAESNPDVSKPVLSITYYSTRCILLSIIMWSWTLCSKNLRAQAVQLWKNRSFMPALAGLFASMCYILVLLSMNYVSNVSYVQVFRQLGLVIGLVESFIILKERVAVPKIIGVALILLGLALSVLK